MSKSETLALQRAINAEFGWGLREDGIYGPQTAEAYQYYLNQKTPRNVPTPAPAGAKPWYLSRVGTSKLGSLQRAFYRPAVFEATAKPTIRETEVPCPFSYSSSLSVVGYELGAAGHARSPAVVSLLGTRCPTAVFWGVRPVVVDSVDRCADRLVSHVGIESRKRLAPRLTYSNTTSAVIGVIVVAGVGASLDQSFPGVVLPRVQKAVRRIATKATASVSCWLFQIIGGAREKTTAVADAQPNGVAARVNVNRRNSHRPTKYLATEILRAIGEWYHFESHFGTPNIELARWARASIPRLPSIIAATKKGCLA